MNIALINPQDKNSTVLVKSFLQNSLDMLPLGLLYIGTLLKRNGYGVRIFDLNCNPGDIHQVIHDIISFQPKIIGITTTTSNYTNTKSLITELKKELDPSVKIVWGGPHVTYLPEEPLQSGLADIVVRGEGEYVMLEIAGILLRKDEQALQNVRGISFVENGAIIHNSPALLRIKELDGLPFPDRSLINIERYKNPSTVIASRGCVGNCQFCSSATWGSITYRNPENVVAEIIEMNNKYGYQQIAFVDNVFVFDQKRTYTLLNLIKDTGLPLSLSAEVNIRYVDENVIQQFGAVNLKSVQFGIESGNEAILRDIEKEISLAEVVKKVELCLKHNLKVVCSFIIGHPNDTKETVNDTINYAVSLKRMGAQVAISILTPYPGSKVLMTIHLDKVSDKKLPVIKESKPKIRPFVPGKG